MPQEHEFMTITELSDLLRVPRATVYYWRYSGTGPRGLRFGKQVRYRRSDVERWIDEQN